MTRTLSLLVLCLSLAGSGCAGVGEDPRVQVSVRSAQWLGSDAPLASTMVGTANLAVALRVVNQQAGLLSLAPSHFVLQTSDGYLYRGNPLTPAWPGGCNASASVVAGATIECTALFSLSASSPVSQVGYAFDDGATSVVRIAVNACTWCGAQCVDLASDPNHCGACNQDVTDGRCESGKVTCGAGLTRCGSECVNLQTDLENCGACGKRVYGATCLNGTATCSLPLSACGQSCTNLSTDARNCGFCGAVCPSGYACLSGQCHCPVGETICGAGCVDTQRDVDNCGTCGHACTSSQICANGSCTYSSGGGGGGGSGGGCSMNCSQVGLSCCGSSCC